MDCDVYPWGWFLDIMGFFLAQDNVFVYFSSSDFLSNKMGLLVLPNSPSLVFKAAFLNVLS